jgi:hypothetical protein
VISKPLCLSALCYGHLQDGLNDHLHDHNGRPLGVALATSLLHIITEINQAPKLQMVATFPDHRWSYALNRDRSNVVVATFANHYLPCKAGVERDCAASIGP